MSPPKEPYFELNPEHVKQIKKEREKAQQLRKTQWWKTLLQKGKCHYCEKIYKPIELTMDHVVPLARGGKSTKGNCVPSCKSCNSKKKLQTPVDLIFENLKRRETIDEES